MATVSVIITTYNYGHMLAESIDSVLNQDYADAELIVVDDGSTDNTVDVVARYGDRVRYVEQPHAGIAVARNTGIQAARGQFIAFQDADDIWTANTLGLKVRAMEQHPELGMVFGDAAVVRDGETVFASFLAERKVLREVRIVREPDDLCIIAESAFPALLRERFVPIPSIIIPKRRFDEVGLWDPTAEGVEDYEFYLRLAKRFRIGYIDRVLVSCRIHGGNVSCDVIQQNSRRIKLLRRFENDRDLSAVDKRRLRLRVSELYLESAWHLKGVGDYAGAHGDYWSAWLYNRARLGALLRWMVTSFGGRSAR